MNFVQDGHEAAGLRTLALILSGASGAGVAYLPRALRRVTGFCGGLEWELAYAGKQCQGGLQVTSVYSNVLCADAVLEAASWLQNYMRLGFGASRQGPVLS